MSLAYVDSGGGDRSDPVLLVHGLGGRWQHWSRVIAGLAADRRVIAVDLPGFGESTSPEGPFALSDLADLLASAIRALELPGVIFAGHSFGGPLATTFAHRHPDLARKLVIVAGTVQTFQRTLGGRLSPWLRNPRTALATICELVYTALPVPSGLRGPISRSRALRSLALWPFVLAPARLDPEDASLLIDGSGAPGVLPTARAIGAARGWERLDVAVPVALINGDHDRIAPLADLRGYPGRVDRALIVHATGHVPMIERPDAFVDAFEKAIAD